MATQPHTLLTKSTGTSFIFSALKTFLLLWVSEMEGRRACSVQLTTIPRAFKMFSLHIGHVQCSLSHGSTQALWKTCLGEQTRHIYNLQTIILRHENYFNALLNCFFKSAGQILELPASCANCSKKKRNKNLKLLLPVTISISKQNLVLNQEGGLQIHQKSVSFKSQH